ncbi:MAG TPA: serine/threonine-protein kinase [Ktedonosporobacter sp.]|nr:serine/threonine-protein kinase [Ktedonosporobacter sp.]
MVADSHKLLGQTLGTCTLQRLIGRGGMGAVYLAQQTRPRRIVAVKVLMPGTFLEQRPRAEFLARFRREADAIAALDHVNIMPIYEYGEQEDLAYLVMPYVTGGTLAQLLEKRGKLPLDEIIPIIDQAASGLDFAHSQGIIHRDLKPGNILFHADGRVLLADFGLAKMLNDSEENEENGHITVTTTGSIIGTPEYLAPEQGTGKAVDSRTDIYALGVVLYRMLAGRVPFMGMSPVAVAIKHAMEDPPSLVQIDSSISHSVEAVVMKAMAKMPEERFASAGDLARALHNAASNTEQTQPIASSGAEFSGQPAPITLSSDGTQPHRDIEDIHNEPTEESPLIKPPAGKKGTRASQKARGGNQRSKEVQPLPVTAEEISQKQAFPHTQMEDIDSLAETVLSKPAKALEKREPVQLATQVVIPEQSKLEVRPHAGCQSIGMMLLGSLLTLLLVVGGFAWYLKPWITNQMNPTPTAITLRPTAATQVPLPGAAIPAGPLLYGSASPGANCDKQGDKWSNTSGAHVTCGTNVTTITNTGTDQAEGSILEALPAGKALPQDFIIQAQVDLNATHGEFGVFFRTQAGPPLTSYIFLINPAAGTWRVTASDGTQIVPPLPLQGKMSGTITIDVRVQGQGPDFYINGVRQGGTEGLGITTGAFGLAVRGGATMVVKNLEIYALT